MVPYVINDSFLDSQQTEFGQTAMTLADFESLALTNNPNRRADKYHIVAEIRERIA